MKALALLLLPAILLGVLLSGGRAEGSRLERALSQDAILPTNVPPGALTTIISYVDALNEAAHTGNAWRLRTTAFEGCGCLAIANTWESIYEKANVVGGEYRITSITPIDIGSTSLSLEVHIHRSMMVHIDRKSGAREVWDPKDSTTMFQEKFINGTWWIVQSR
jgi:hypothetical protein